MRKTQAKLLQICANWICVTHLIFSKGKKRFQQKAKSKEFLYSPERPRTGISKPNCVKVVYLLSRNLKVNYPRNKPIPYKCPILWKTQPNYFKFGQIEPRSKKLISSQSTSRESFLCAETARKILLKANIVVAICVTDLIFPESKKTFSEKS